MTSDGNSSIPVNQVRDGDVIDLIDGQSTHDLPLAVIRFMLEGAPGSTITLSVVRPFKPDPDKYRSFLASNSKGA